jgi:DNA-binding response OmpR family regulator
LLAEDDAAISEPLARAFRREGYDVEVASSGAAALSGVSRSTDLVVLDLGLPDLDGLDVCRRLRSSGCQVPVLILTARGGELDAVVGLDAGADDYVAKPFRIGELLARVRALLRRSGAETDVLEAQDLWVDVAARRVWRGAVQIVLSPKEHDLLVALVTRKGAVASREDLMREVWHTDWMGSRKTVDMHVSGLRRKLGDDVTAPRYITTVRGVGFRFEGG